MNHSMFSAHFFCVCKFTPPFTPPLNAWPILTSQHGGLFLFPSIHRKTCILLNDTKNPHFSYSLLTFLLWNTNAERKTFQLEDPTLYISADIDSFIQKHEKTSFFKNSSSACSLSMNADRNPSKEVVTVQKHLPLLLPPVEGYPWLTALHLCQNLQKLPSLVIIRVHLGLDHYKTKTFLLTTKKKSHIVPEYKFSYPCDED